MTGTISSAIRWVTFISLVASISLLPGCKDYDVVRINGEYSTFVMKSGVARFSFEYPNKYDLGSVNKDQDRTDGYLFGPPIGAAQDSTLISFDVSKPEPGQNGYQYYLDNSIRIDSGHYEFKILERLPVTVAGESGEEVALSFKSYRLNEQAMRGIPPAYFTVRRVMFWHSDLLWWIEIRGLESSAEADKADFEHVIRTFKILD